MKLLNWLSESAAPGGLPDDGVWVSVTTTLSAFVALGYCAIAINWYFQSKLPSLREAGRSLRRLLVISLACLVCGYGFYAADTPWHVWRMYDAILIILAAYTWAVVLRMRGWSLVRERLARIDDLERAATQYHEIAELLPHMVWTSTAQGAIDFSNRRWRDYTGGDGRTWLDAVHPDERERVRARWDAALASRSPLALEARLAGAAGYRTFDVRATPICQGKAVKWLGACADIEDQRLLAVEKERQARQRAFFLNAISHDLRAPLHNVLLNAQLLKMSVGDADGSADSVEMIVENAVAAGDMVSRLLDFAKVGAQDQNEIESVSLAPVLHQVARRFQPLAAQKGLSLVVTAAAAAGDTRVLTDRQKLERIIANLLDNAIKYTRRGGVTLELAASGGAAGGGGEAIIRVSDTGIGVPADEAPHLFNEFYQVGNYERDRSKGFGMGLAICKSLARHVGGDVRLARTGPDGSCFELLVRSVGPDRRGRPPGPPGDHADPQEAGLCHI